MAAAQPRCETTTPPCAFFERLVHNAKPKMVAIVCSRRQIVVIANMEVPNHFNPPQQVDDDRGSTQMKFIPAVPSMPQHLTACRFAWIGIVLTLALGSPAQGVEARPLVAGVHGIATGLAACWRPPHDDDQVTVRVSFTRDGAVIGEPRIVFTRSSGGKADDSALAQSMLSAISDCTPLHFSARLGSAIAGQVLDIRFIGRRRATIVAPP